MKNDTGRAKCVSLTIRGFTSQAQEVADLIGVQSSHQGNVGELVRPYVKTLLTRSYVQYTIEYSNEVALSEMLAPLIQKLGGTQNLIDVQGKVKAEFLELHFDLPSISSEFPQDGYFSNSDIQICSELNTSISLGFF
ncbi:hypothetical protein [Massilia sp. DWR3-1-1]|uniref:hypothetical protein n=1 Tax=Massilia sp. DWR3-1-1 TaxID=2804559 RepID=UPI003CE70D02